MVSLVLSKFLTEHVTDQFRLLILVVLNWMEAPWLPTILNMLVDIPHCCPTIQSLIMNFLVDWVLKGLPSLHLTLAAQRCVLCRQEFSSAVCQTVAVASQVSMVKVTSNARSNGSVGVVQRVFQMMPFLALKKRNCWFTYLGLDCLDTVGIYHSGISAFGTSSSSQGFKPS